MAVIDGNPHWNLPRTGWGEGGNAAAEALASEAQGLGAYLVRGVLAIRLPCSCSPCQSPGADVAEIDLSLGRRASTGLAPDNDGAARKDLARKEDRQALGGPAKTHPTAQQAPGSTQRNLSHEPWPSSWGRGEISPPGKLPLRKELALRGICQTPELRLRSSTEAEQRKEGAFHVQTFCPRSEATSPPPVLQ